MSELALKLIAQAKETRATRLDLGNCGLTELPDELFELTWLEELILSSHWYEYSFEKEKEEHFISQNKGKVNNIKFISPKVKLLKGLKKIIASYQKNFSDLNPLKDLMTLQQLDISYSQVSDLSPLKDLKTLQQLVLQQTQVSDLSPLKDLTALKQLNVSSTQVSNLNPLKELLALQQLSISSTKVSDLDPLKNLLQLQVLDAPKSQVVDLSPLKRLINLKNINFSSTQVINLDILKGLINLQDIRFVNTQIKDIKALECLKNLKLIYLWQTPVFDISPLQDLLQLQELHIDYTKVKDLSYLKNLVQLHSLDISSTQVSDLTPLINLMQLQQLYISNIKIRDLTTLNNLTQLQQLDVQNCKIKDFEAIIPFLDKKQFPNLRELNVHGNPLNDVEEKYLGTENENVLDRLRKFYKQWLKGERRRLYEAKLILVGEGAVGKTSLKQKLKANKIYVAKPNKTPSTEGILYEPWDLKGCLVEGMKRDVRINIWDFGGQEVDHQTHQFFLSRNSFYVYVSNSRLSDAQSKFDYWLNIIHKLAPESPILLVRNLFDNQQEPYRFKEWLKKYPEQISAKPITIDCTEKDNAGVNEVLEYIKTKISELESVGKIWPKSYADIREDLEELVAKGKNYIEETEYLDICTKHEIDNEEARDLSRTLHSIGTILHYQDNKEAEDLKDWVILRPEWVTKAFYRIVRNGDINLAKGKFNKDQLRAIWWKDEGDKAKYPLSIFNLLIDLMKAFDLCFQIGSKKEYIVPQLLNEEENEIAKQQVEGDDVLRFEYHYSDVIPAGMISRFICKQHNNIPKDKLGNYLYWRYGALMKHEETVALIEQPIGDKCIKITVKGTAKRELLAIIRNAFDELHVPLNNLKPEEVLPCNCSVCIKSDKPFSFKYEVIKRRLQKEDVYELCGISDEQVDRRKLFNDAIDEAFMDIEKVRQYIAEGKPEKAILYLKDKDLKALLRGQLSQIQMQEILGLVETDDILKHRNKLSSSILKSILDSE